MIYTLQNKFLSTFQKMYFTKWGETFLASVFTIKTGRYTEYLNLGLVCFGSGVSEFH